MHAGCRVCDGPARDTLLYNQLSIIIMLHGPRNNQQHAAPTHHTGHGQHASATLRCLAARMNQMQQGGGAWVGHLRVAAAAAAPAPAATQPAPHLQYAVAALTRSNTTSYCLAARDQLKSLAMPASWMARQRSGCSSYTPMAAVTASMKHSRLAGEKVQPHPRSRPLSATSAGVVMAAAAAVG